MWEAIGNIFTSEAFLHNMPSILLLILTVCIMVKLGIIKVKTNHVQIGNENSDSYYERTIVRNQINYAHDYIYALEHKINDMIETQTYNGFMTKYILERIYDKIIEWITFNHIENSEAYISCKQLELDNLVYGLVTRDEFRTPEFQERMHQWTKELVEQLVKIRKLYKEK